MCRQKQNNNTILPEVECPFLMMMIERLYIYSANVRAVNNIILYFGCVLLASPVIYHKPKKTTQGIKKKQREEVYLHINI